MTSSATPTEAQPSGRHVAGGARQELLIGGSLLAAGWLLVLYIHHWHVTAPVVFLCIGWAGVLGVGRFLWQAGVMAAAEGEGEENEGFDLAATRREELEREKKALLKAIKEVEFDRSMGKMSEEDADEITRFYRVRAIEVLKHIERLDNGEAPVGAESAEELIDREIRARLALVKGGTPKKAPPKKGEAKESSKEKEEEKEKEAES